MLHHKVEHILFMPSRSRRDSQTAVVFLKRCVKNPDEDYWSKIVRVLKYFKVKRGLNLTLCVDDLFIINWWVDASYEVQKD